MPRNEKQKCPICDRDAHVATLGDGYLVQCTYCGNFQVVGSTMPSFGVFRSDPDYAELLPYLSAYTRQASERHQDVILDTRNGIYLAVKEDCKMDPIRIVLVHHNEKICDKIMAEIRTCQFLVADFTLQRAGVYFEAGFAMGLGRPVIWTCREDDFDNVHFDTRQYNHIVWETPQELRTKLADRIRATISREN